MDDKKVLFLATTYNQLEYTKICIESLRKVKDVNLDILVVDDCSDDDTVSWCKKQQDVILITKDSPEGLTDSWNKGYKYFRDNNYNYFVKADNDVIVPNGALSEMAAVLDRWPACLVSPMGNKIGVGHNPVQFIGNYFNGLAEVSEEGENTQNIQDNLFAAKNDLKSKKDLFYLDPFRMKHFNGYTWMTNRDVIKYERPDGNLFDPTFFIVKNEDEFNWKVLLPNDDNPMVCRTAYIYHFKGKSTYSLFDNFSADIGKQPTNKDNWLRERKKIKERYAK